MNRSSCLINSTHNAENHKEFNQRLTKVATAVKCSIVALGFGVSATSNAATIEVTSHLDDGTRCTLREAVVSVSNRVSENGCLEAGFFTDDNTITFASNLTSNTITLASGQLSFTDESVPLSIDASNISGGITINAAPNSRILYTQSATLTLDNLTIRGGSPIGVGGGIYAGDGTTLSINDTTISNNVARGNGGGIYLATANLTATSSLVSANLAADPSSDPYSFSNTRGGGIYANDSQITLIETTISGNDADSGGGLGANDTDSIIINSTFDSNTADSSGGGIFNRGVSTISVSHSTLSNNSAGYGGGISNNGSLTISNSTVSANSAQMAGGLDTLRTTLITNSTFSDNSAERFGGGIIVSGGINRPLETTISNSLISGNLASVGFSEIFVRYSDIINEAITQNSLIGHSSLTSDMAFGSAFVPSDTDIIATSDGSNITLTQILAPLAQNSGDTQTHALPAGSPAIDAANRSNCPTTDQRGETRGFLCDIGAYEFNTNDQDSSFYVIPLSDGKVVVIPL